MSKTERVWGNRHGVTKWMAVIFVVLLLLMLGSCTKAPSKEEMVSQREKNAKEDLELIKPPRTINFEQPLTLEQAIKFALENNLELRVKDFDRQIANRETVAQKLKMLPGLNLDASYTYRDKLRKSDVYNWLEDRDVPDYTVSELKDSGRANLSLTFNVIDFAIAYVRSGAMEMKERVKDFERKRQAQQLALDVTEAYWQAAALEDALDYVHLVEAKLKSVKETIDRSVKEGQLDRMDGAEVEMRLKELELTIRQLQANLSSARLKLGRLMGLNQNVQFTLARPPIKPIVAALPHTKDLDIDALEERALTHRPELYETDLQVLIQKDDAKAAVLSMFPGLNLFAATHFDDNRLLLSNTWNSVGAGVGWQLLDIPSRYAQYQGHQKAVEMAKAQRLMMTVGVITQVHIALLDYAIKLDRFRLLEETHMLAQNLLEMATEKNKVGRLPALAVTQRQLEEMAAKLRRDEAVVDLLVAHKRLCVSIGTDPLECDEMVKYASKGRVIEMIDSKYSASASGTGATTTSTTGSKIEDVDLKPSYSAGTSSDTSGKMWKCNVCGYIHKGDQPPEICPECGAPKNEFVPWSPESSPGTRGVMADIANNYLWKVQIGSFTQPGAADRRLDQIKDIDLRLLDNRDTKITTFPYRGKLYNRVRVLGLTKAEARMMSEQLAKRGMEYWIIPPNSAHW